MSMNGIDISSWQSGIDLSVVPCDFVIIKATEGTTYVNPDCDRAYQQAKKLGKCLGVYHFASGGDANAEADYFLNNVKGYVGEAVLVLDWEADAVPKGVSWAKQWLDRVYAKTKVRPMIYMSNSVVNSYDWSSVAANYGLWNAGYYAYGTPMGYNPDAPLIGGTGAWTGGAAMYQYTSEGQLSGWSGNLDLNVFYGDRTAWNKYAGKGNATVPTGNSGSSAESSSASNSVDKTVHFKYRVKTAQDGWLPEVVNLSDYAGIPGHAITDIAIGVDKGSLWYQVHVKGGSWLPAVSGYNIADYNNGYAGNGREIDAVRVYYNTPADYVAKYGYQKAQYRVSPLNGNYWPWQYDNETGGGQDGYAGAFGYSIDKFQLY